MIVDQDEIEKEYARAVQTLETLRKIQEMNKEIVRLQQELGKKKEEKITFLKV